MVIANGLKDVSFKSGASLKYRRLYLPEGRVWQTTAAQMTTEIRWRLTLRRDAGILDELAVDGWHVLQCGTDIS